MVSFLDVTNRLIMYSGLTFLKEQLHSMAKANLNKSEELVTNAIPQHQNTYLRSPESTSIEILPFRLYFIRFPGTVFHDVNLVPQFLHLEVLLLTGPSEGLKIRECQYYLMGIICPPRLR